MTTSLNINEALLKEALELDNQVNIDSLQDLRNWHIGKVRQISKICLFAGFMQSDAPYNRFLV